VDLMIKHTLQMPWQKQDNMLEQAKKMEREIIEIVEKLVG